MKTAILTQCNPNMFPALYRLAVQLAEHGSDVRFASRYEPNLDGDRSSRITWIGLPKIGRFAKRLPFFRSVYPRMMLDLVRYRPDWIIGENEYVVPALLYKRAFVLGKVRIAGYFSDYYSQGKSIAPLAGMANRLDAYVDVCDMRVRWRRRDWPRMTAAPFVIRHATDQQAVVAYRPHAGPPRVVCTGSRVMLEMNRDRLSRFIMRLCNNGVSFDWYVTGFSELRSGEDLRSEARSLADHPLFSIRAPVAKSHLLATLSEYDAGLFWAPVVEVDDPVMDPKSGLADPNLRKSLFLSSASNKVGEYIAAGLVVAYGGNPGLAYLPEEVCAVFDPTDPEAGADQLAAKLSDRSAVERKRQAALRYHRDELNFEMQAAPFVRYVTNGGT